MGKDKRGRTEAEPQVEEKAAEQEPVEGVGQGPEVPLDEANESEKVPGVLFWFRRRYETSAGPQYEEDVNAKIPGPHIATSAEYVRVEYPRGSGRHLIINGSKRIDDKHIVCFLILKNKPARGAGLGKGSKAGVLLYDPKEVVKLGYMTEKELENAAVKSIPPKWFRNPGEPPPDFNMLSEADLDRFARDKNIQSYDTAANLFTKRGILAQWSATRR